METVTFKTMAEGTKADYDLLGRYEEEYMRTLPDRLLAALEGLRTSFAGYQVSRYEHSLQSATRALRDGKDDEYIVAALLHDIGDELAPYTHGEMAGAVLRPFIRPELYCAVKYHGLFQMYYYGEHTGDDPNGRDEYRDNPHYDACVEFCERYDQNCFDPDYDWLPASEFEAAVRRVISEPKYL